MLKNEGEFSDRAFTIEIAIVEINTSQLKHDLSFLTWTRWSVTAVKDWEFERGSSHLNLPHPYGYMAIRVYSYGT